MLPIQSNLWMLMHLSTILARWVPVGLFARTRTQAPASRVGFVGSSRIAGLEASLGRLLCVPK